MRHTIYTASPQCFLGWRQVAPKMRYALEAARPQCRAPLHTMHPSRGDRRRLPKKMRYRRLERYPFMSSSSRLRSLRSLRAVKARYAIATAAIAATITSTGAKMSRAAMTDTIPSDTNRAQDTPCAPYSAACVPQGARPSHALRCKPKTGRRTRGARATHRKPDTAQGARAPRAPVRAPNKRARSPRAAIHAPHEGHTCHVPRPARMQGTRARDPRRSGARAPRPARRAGTNTPYRAYCGFSIADCAAPSTELRKPQSDGEQMCAPARELAPCRRVQWFGTYPSRLREHHDR